MPSPLHQILGELFANGKQLVLELLRTCAGIDLGEVTVEQGSVDLSQAVSTEYRADQLLLFRNPDRSLACAVIIEIQLRPDTRKRTAWPQYVTAAGRRFRCPVLLLVFAPDPAVARWARQPIETGHPGFTLRPLVISYDDIPRVVEPQLASRAPELSVLSALAHPEEQIALTAITAIRQLPEDQLKLYFDLIWQSLSDSVRHALEAHMQNYEYQSDFARKYIAQGRQEGRLEGKQEGRLEGKQEGRLEGKQEGQRTAVLALARAKLGALAPSDEALIADLRDEATLTALIVDLGQAQDAQQARLALRRASQR